MIDIDAKVDKKSLSNVLNMLNPKHRNAALVAALNVTVREVRKEAKLEVEKVFTVKKRTLGNSMKDLVLAKRGRYRAIFKVKSSPLPLMAFKAKQKKPTKKAVGTSAEVFRGKRTMYKHAFIQTMRNAKQVWIRRGNKRLPVIRLTTFSTAAMTKIAATKKIKSTSQNFQKHFHSKLSDRIRKNRKK